VVDGCKRTNIVGVRTEVSFSNTVGSGKDRIVIDQNSPVMQCLRERSSHHIWGVMVRYTVGLSNG